MTGRARTILNDDYIVRPPQCIAGNRKRIIGSNYSSFPVNLKSVIKLSVLTQPQQASLTCDPLLIMLEVETEQTIPRGPIILWQM